jgi:catechol 2,3-dioxygenase-like lactoylglutathione lyase family enzyme
MEVKYSATVLFVKNIKKSFEFYTHYLDQVTKHDFGANIIFKSGLSLWEISPSHEISRHSGINDIKSKISGRFETYFETENIDGSFSRIKVSGVAFLHEIIEEPWGQRTFRFYDPDGHLVEIGETMETFVKRAYQKYGTAVKASEKTSVPLETVERILKGLT